jgi:hypothetical protein
MDEVGHVMWQNQALNFVAVEFVILNHLEVFCMDYLYTASSMSSSNGVSVVF